MHKRSPTRRGEGGSPVTKLADEACDLFKGTPKSQHQNKLEQRIKQTRNTCICKKGNNLW